MEFRVILLYSIKVWSTKERQGGGGEKKDEGSKTAGRVVFSRAHEAPELMCSSLSLDLPVANDRLAIYHN